MGFLDKIFSGGAGEVIKSVGGVLDNLITNKEELAQAKLEAEKEINRHFEAIQADTTKQLELEYQDRASARTRESEFIKATGHVDYIVWVLVIVAMSIFSFMVYSVVKGTVPAENRELIFHIFGIVEGFILSIFTYYFGSSAGSRLKDMKPK